MKALLLLTLLLAGCTGCGSESAEVNSELRPILNEYWQFAPNAGKYDLIESIDFGPVNDGDAIGTCETDWERIAGVKTKEVRKIIIDPKAKTWGPQFFKTAVLHELGHCIHDLRHTKGKYDIMNPRRYGDSVFWTQERIDQATVAMFNK